MKEFLYSFIVLTFFQWNLCSQTQPVKDTLIVGYTSAPPFIVENNGTLEGINVLLWQKVAKDLDIPYTLKKMNFPEMLTSLRNGSIDVSINPLTITSDRSKQMEFTHSFFASNSTIVVKQKSSLQKLIQFLRAFFNANFVKAIIFLFLVIFIFGTVLWLFERKKNNHFRPAFKGVWDGFWWAAVTLTTVGYGDKSPISRGGKITALLLMFSGLLFISGLTASIASNLTVNELNNSPNSFVMFKDKRVGTIAKSSSREFLSEHFFKNVKEYEGTQLGLEALLNDKIDAFMYDTPILKYRIADDPKFKKLQVLPIKFDAQFYAFGISKEKREVEQMISQKILEIIEKQEWEIILNEYNLSEI